MGASPTNCDAVFEVLTRGPFPSGAAEDAAVERHLRCCHACQSLAEALRPAVALLHESVTEFEGRDLPSYHGPRPRPSLTEWFVGDQPNRWGFTRSGVTAVSMLSLVVALLAAVVQWSAPPSFRAARVAPPPVAQQTQRGDAWLQTLALGDACLSEPVHRRFGGEARSSDASADVTKTSCCTQCHVWSGAPRLSRVAMDTFLASCRACHGSPAVSTAVRASWRRLPQPGAALRATPLLALVRLLEKRSELSDAAAPALARAATPICATRRRSSWMGSRPRPLYRDWEERRRTGNSLGSRVG